MNPIQKYWEALQDVEDPEFPISVVDMGLIYEITTEEAGTVNVVMTYTTTACPCMKWIEEDIRKRLLQEPGVNEVQIHVTWDPPWTADRLSEKGRRVLEEWGVSSIEAQQNL